MKTQSLRSNQMSPQIPIWRLLLVMAADVMLIVAVVYSLSFAMGNPLIIGMCAICFISWNYQRGFKAWRMFFKQIRAKNSSN